MWNAGETPARMIEVISPAGFEHFFWAMSALMDGTSRSEVGRGPCREVWAGVRKRSWIDDVVARYNLTPPPGR